MLGILKGLLKRGYPLGDSIDFQHRKGFQRYNGLEKGPKEECPSMLEACDRREGEGDCFSPLPLPIVDILSSLA